MSRESRSLARDLRAMGISADETAELVRAAEQLSKFHVPGLSAAGYDRVASRLPVDVTVHKSNQNFALRWTMAGATALVLLVAASGLLLLYHGTPKHAEQAHEVTQPKQVKSTPQQQSVQPQELQPTVAPQSTPDTSSDSTNMGTQGENSNPSKSIANQGKNTPQQSEKASSVIVTPITEQRNSTSQSSPLKTILNKVTTALPLHLPNLL